MPTRSVPAELSIDVVIAMPEESVARTCEPAQAVNRQPEKVMPMQLARISTCGKVSGFDGTLPCHLQPRKESMRVYWSSKHALYWSRSQRQASNLKLLLL